MKRHEDVSLRMRSRTRPGTRPILAIADGVPAGYVTFYRTYSTFLARPSFYLEDIFVREEFRHHGIGRESLSFCRKIARERGCERMDWKVLTWNEPAIRFYENERGKRLEWYSLPDRTGGTLKLSVDVAEAFCLNLMLNNRKMGADAPYPLWDNCRHFEEPERFFSHLTPSGFDAPKDAPRQVQLPVFRKPNLPRRAP